MGKRINRVAYNKTKIAESNQKEIMNKANKA